MTNAAHSDFFGLDLGVGYAPAPDYIVPNDTSERAEAVLQKWMHVTPSIAKAAAGALPPVTYGTTPSSTAPSVSFVDMLPNPDSPPATASPNTPSVPSTQQGADSARTTPIQPLTDIPPNPSLYSAKKRGSPSFSCPPAKTQKTFHFVANNDKKTAARIRNTMTSRNLRQSKVSRIAELERALERQREESEMWRRRAVEAGWNDG